MRILRTMPAACAALLVAMLGAGAPAADVITVGDFVKRVAASKNLAAHTPEMARDSLRTAGCGAAMKLEDTLTEGAVVDISRCVGVKVSSERRDAEFTASQVDAYFSAFAQKLSTGSDDDATGSSSHSNGADPLTKGKGKKKGLRSPDDPL